MLIPGQVYYPCWREIHQTKGDRFTTDTEAEPRRVHNLRAFFTEFLFNGSVLEYNGDAMWYDVHPIIQEIERFREAVTHVESQDEAPAAELSATRTTRNLRKLALFLEEAVGFRLGLATYDTPQTRKTQLDRLAEAVASRPVHLTRLDLSRTPNETQLLRRLQEHLQREPRPRGETPGRHGRRPGGHAGLPQARTPTPAEGLAILHNANVQRDAFPRALPRARGDLAEPDGHDDLRPARPPTSGTGAPRSFHFTGPPDERQRLERTQVAMPLIESDRLPRERKHERIALLRDLLVEMENAEGSGFIRVARHVVRHFGSSSA